MVTVVIVIHLMVVLAMIGLVLLQRSDGGALGIGGGGGGGNFLSGRGAGNVLTRSTAIFACAFFATSIALTVLARMESRPSDILDRLSTEAPVTAPAAPAPVAPAPSDAPSAQSVLDSLGAPQATQEPAPAAPAPASSATEPAPAAPAGTTGQGQ